MFKIDPKNKFYPRVKNIAQRTARSLLSETIPTTIVPGVGKVADITMSAFIIRLLYKKAGPINENLIQKAINENEVFQTDRAIAYTMRDLSLYGMVEKVRKGYTLTQEMRELVEEFRPHI